MTTLPRRPGSQAVLEAALAAHGLNLRGAWRPTAQDALPALPGARQAAVVWMVGQLGAQSWEPFKSSRFFSDGLPDPLDRWSQSIGDALALEFGGLALYPFGGPPWHPFQQWAMRAEPLYASPIKLLIHPKYGLWHAYRFALALPDWVDGEAQDNSLECHSRLDRESTASRSLTSDGSWIPGQAGNDGLTGGNDRSSLNGLSSICAQCDGQPCLSACPVDAFSGSAYLVQRCATHLHSPEGTACMRQGCQARLACPVGAQHRYDTEQAGFHMAAFASQH